MSEVAVLDGEVEWGFAVVVFYGGEQVCGDPGDLIEVAVTGGGVEWGLASAVVYGGEEFNTDTAKVLQVAFGGGLVQSGGAVVAVNDDSGEGVGSWFVGRHGLLLLVGFIEAWRALWASK